MTLQGTVLRPYQFIDEDLDHVIYVTTENGKPGVNQRCTMPRTSEEMLGHLNQVTSMMEGLAPRLNYHRNIVSLFLIAT